MVSTHRVSCVSKMAGDFGVTEKPRGYWIFPYFFLSLPGECLHLPKILPGCVLPSVASDFSAFLPKLSLSHHFTRWLLLSLNPLPQSRGRLLSLLPKIQGTQDCDVLMKFPNRNYNVGKYLNWTLEETAPRVYLTWPISSLHLHAAR